jgi:hypothetical protein
MDGGLILSHLFRDRGNPGSSTMGGVSVCSSSSAGVFGVNGRGMVDGGGGRQRRQWRSDDSGRCLFFEMELSYYFLR